MTITAVFDSSAVILYFNDALSAAALAVIDQAIEEGTGAISVVTRAEVLAWPQHTAQSLQEAITGMASFEQLNVDAAVADEAARIRRECNLKLPDALIAATVTLRGLPVVTANARDFERVVQLRVVRF
jgi:predicted nucleic acid-binding protein